MPICRLRIHTFRNIESAELSFGRVNVISGENGSGKTSILEAIHVLGSGRSFRTPRPDPLIKQGADRFALHGMLSDSQGVDAAHSVGVTRDRSGGFEARVQGRDVHNTAELARSLPTLLINATSFELLDGGPRKRRQFLDWGVFHVEPSFHSLWIDVQRALSQRNALLRHARIAAPQLEAWDIRLAELSDRLDALRDRYFKQFTPGFHGALHQLGDVPGIELAYHRGWEHGRGLLEVLQEHRERDTERGYTGAGPHRADIRVRTDGQSAIDVLSRGQQKLVVCAMKIAQGRLFAEERHAEVMFLVDDLPAELDRRHRLELCRLVAAMPCQIVVSCVDAADLAGCWDGIPADQIRLFHVEHGRPIRVPVQQADMSI